MKKRVLQLLAVAVLVLSLAAVDSITSSLNGQLQVKSSPALMATSGLVGLSAITGAVVGTDSPKCEQKAPCAYPSGWKCMSNSKCYDYSDCLVRCPSSSQPEQPTLQECICGDWQTSGGCGGGGCPSNKVPQSKSCTGGSTCKTESRCLESAQCTSLTPGEGQGQTPEGVKEGVNLVPELEISPSEGLKSGDTMEVTFYIKNLGSKAATQYDMKEKGTTTLINIIYFYKEKEYGPDVIQPIHAPVSILLLQGSAIKPGEAGKVQLAKQTVKIPDDFSGDLVIAAVVDAQFSYPETNENDNRPTRTLSVRPLVKPNLAITGFETSIRSFDVLPVAIGPVFITVENRGELLAASTQPIQNKVSIFKGDTEICRATAKESMVEGIVPGKQRKFALDPRFITESMAGNQCSVDGADANYRAVVEIDTPQLDAQGDVLQGGVIAESSENDNKQPFAIKAREKCSPLGKIEAVTYCDIATGTWLAQKTPGQQCSHNFECNLELCVKGKCVTQEQKGRILAIVG